MSIAEECAKMSRAVRLQVGSVIVKNDNIISFSWNGMPSGWDNNCEYEVTEFSSAEFGKSQTFEKTGELKTKPEVLHAETNCIAKLAKSTESGLGASMFITHAPCLNCAKLIYQSGIGSVLYRDAYRDTSGVEFLERSGVQVEQVEKGS